MADAPPEKRGILESLKAFTATLLAIAHTRGELLSTELQELQQRLLLQLAALLLALFLLGVGLIMAVLLIVVVFWDSHRVLALGLLTTLFLVGSGALLLSMRHMARRAPRPFAATLAELAKDRAELTGVASRPPGS